MTYHFRPPVRENTPLTIGIAGPTKSGKTFSAHRLAKGLAGGKPILMLNAEGPKGHQYVDKFSYLACDVTRPYRPTVYTEVLRDAAKLNPGVVIVDSASHMHDGPGGLLEWHVEVQKRMARGNEEKMEKVKAAAWVEVKAAENEFIYQLEEMRCHVILCFRAKEKIKITKEGKWIELGWQPIATDRIAFETIFTLMLLPHSKGVPDLSISDMREPFDAMIDPKKPIDEDLGRQLAEWARANDTKPAATDDRHKLAVAEIVKTLNSLPSNAAKAKVSQSVLGVATRAEIEALPISTLEGALIPVAVNGPTKIEAEAIRWREANERAS